MAGLCEEGRKGAEGSAQVEVKDTSLTQNRGAAHKLQRRPLRRDWEAEDPEFRTVCNVCKSETQQALRCSAAASEASRRRPFSAIRRFGGSGRSRH